MADPLTPERPTTERQRIHNLIDQFAAGCHTADEMPALILATLDAERAAVPAPVTPDLIAAAQAVVDHRVRPRRNP